MWVLKLAILKAPECRSTVNGSRIGLTTGNYSVPIFATRVHPEPEIATQPAEHHYGEYAHLP